MLNSIDSIIFNHDDPDFVKNDLILELNNFIGLNIS
jgi:hypothetical protein